MNNKLNFILNSVFVDVFQITFKNQRGLAHNGINKLCVSKMDQEEANLIRSITIIFKKQLKFKIK
ncbi:hypothetical protein BpHYR1_024889 [Brachionus plicatilis]|uniref:Uncharacterized protein n=1 Tax=Brachionus plicatilis TaxID=10195 RepID=A0A3M7PH54_BRAPC|nr:hypothetical protein BpHYR1_024889 [Brachionus plicatilis]